MRHGTTVQYTAHRLRSNRRSEAEPMGVWTAELSATGGGLMGRACACSTSGRGRRLGPAALPPPLTGASGALSSRPAPAPAPTAAADSGGFCAAGGGCGLSGGAPAGGVACSGGSSPDVAGLLMCLPRRPAAPPRLPVGGCPAPALCRGAPRGAGGGLCAATRGGGRCGWRPPMAWARPRADKSWAGAPPAPLRERGAGATGPAPGSAACGPPPRGACACCCCCCWERGGVLRRRSRVRVRGGPARE